MAEKTDNNPEAPKDSDAESREAETAALRAIQAKVAEVDPDVADLAAEVMTEGLDLDADFADHHSQE